MDLSSHLENQSFDKLEEDSKLSDEQHELPDLPKAKKKTNACGAGMNSCSGCIFFLSMCSAIISVSIFVSENNRTIDLANNDTGGCIMFGTYDDQSKSLNFDNVGMCQFIVYGTAGLGGLSLLYMCGSCCRIVFNCALGLATFNIFSVIDFIVMTMSTLFALTVGIMISLGRAATCNAIKDSPGGSNCKTSLIAKDGKAYDFDQFMYVAEISAWATACAFALMAILNLFYTIALIFKCCKNKQRTSDYENELDAFNRTFAEDDDDPLLDPSKEPVASAPRLHFQEDNNDHSSFPPYNTGTGEGGFYGQQPWSEA